MIVQIPEIKENDCEGCYYYIADKFSKECLRYKQKKEECRTEEHSIWIDNEDPFSEVGDETFKLEE
jgi:hypothetical protein